eukprot:scaffold13_cov377-Prasinococcus_capsulatus_cf.AAC.24
MIPSARIASSLASGSRAAHAWSYELCHLSDTPSQTYAARHTTGRADTFVHEEDRFYLGGVYTLPVA